MEAKGLFLPADATDYWKVMNSSQSMLGFCKGAKRLGEGLALPIIACRVLIADQGFESVDDIHDGQWLMSVGHLIAKGKKALLDGPFSSDFAEMIDDCIEYEAKMRLKQKMDTVIAAVREMTRDNISKKAIAKHKSSIGGNTKTKITRSVSRQIREQLVRGFLDQRVRPCAHCGDNTTAFLRPTTCCGTLFHESCFGDYTQKKIMCPICHEQGILTSTLTCLASAFMPQDLFDQERKKRQEMMHEEAKMAQFQKLGGCKDMKDFVEQLRSSGVDLTELAQVAGVIPVKHTGRPKKPQAEADKPQAEADKTADQLAAMSIAH